MILLGEVEVEENLGVVMSMSLLGVEGGENLLREMANLMKEVVGEVLHPNPRILSVSHSGPAIIYQSVLSIQQSHLHPTNMHCVFLFPSHYYHPRPDQPQGCVFDVPLILIGLKAIATIMKND